MKRVYVAHPYGGLEENKQLVEQYIKEFIKIDKDILFISPIHATGFLYNEVSYEKGMDYCLELLSSCDELWLCGDWTSSKGCNMEFNFAIEHGVKIKGVEK